MEFSVPLAPGLGARYKTQLLQLCSYLLLVRSQPDRHNLAINGFLHLFFQTAWINSEEFGVSSPWLEEQLHSNRARIILKAQDSSRNCSPHMLV